jgi:hypothetical protein
MSNMDSNIFIWHKDYIGYKNNSNIYSDVLVNTGSNRKGEWQNAIAVKYVDNLPRVIENINHFINGRKWPHSYNEKYKIFDNLVNNYNSILENVNNEDLTYYDETTCFSMLDAFSFSNSGHNLSEILDYANYILNNNIKNVIIYKGYKDTHNFKLINLLLSDCIFYEVEFDKIYKFKNLIVIRPVFFNILLHEPLIEKLKNIIIEKYSEVYKECKGKKIILMKTHRNKNVMLPMTQFNCEDFLSNLEKKDYLYIIPEDIDVFKLAIYLLFADTIVYSTGSILYTNKIFFNYNAKLVYMCLPEQLNSCTHKELLDNSLVIKTLHKVDNYYEIIEQIENY